MFKAPEYEKFVFETNMSFQLTLFKWQALEKTDLTIVQCSERSAERSLEHGSFTQFRDLTIIEAEMCIFLKCPISLLTQQQAP